MKTKTIEHTKGEWDVIHVKTEDGLKRGTHEHHFQVVTKAQDHDNHIAQANANLISAAPDLLHSLEYLLRNFDSGRNSAEAIVKANAAIKKATK
jgi:hypothetical protein